MATDYDLDELIGGSVDSITGKFDELTNVQLKQLHDLEQAQSARSTLLGAIHREMTKRGIEHGGAGTGDDDRDDSMSGGGEGGGAGSGDQQSSGQPNPIQATAENAGTDGSQDGPKSSTGDVANGGAPTGETFTRDQLDEALAAQKLRLDADWEAKMAEHAGKAVTASAKGEVAAITLVGQRDPVHLKVLLAPVTVVFVGQDDRPIASLPPMTFRPGDWKPQGDRGAVLDREIEFPTQLPHTEIAAAFVLDDEDDAIGRAPLMVPFPIGGGRSSRLPAGTLRFE